jgi:hypothetical protein
MNYDASVFGCFRRESTWSSGRDVSTALEPLFDATIRRSRTPWTPCVKKRTDRATAQHIFGHAEKQRFLISSIPAAATSGKSVSPVRGPCATACRGVAWRSRATGAGCLPCATCARRPCPAADGSWCSTGSSVHGRGVPCARDSDASITFDTPAPAQRAARSPAITPVSRVRVPRLTHFLQWSYAILTTPWAACCLLSPDQEPGRTTPSRKEVKSAAR